MAELEEARRLCAKEPVRELEQDARSVPGVRIGSAGRAMGQPAKDFESLIDDRA